MNVLLLSMPDSFEHMPSVAIRMPNGALSSIAGNLDGHHQAAIGDLVLARTSVRRTVERLLRSHAPDVVGLSVMTFQRMTALRVARLVRTIRPGARIVVGGYDPSLAPEVYETSPDVDYVVRGEGERTMSELLRALEGRMSLRDVNGLTYRDAGVLIRNPPRAIASLSTDPLKLPRRSYV
jgi:anaerobic magnesium-protoporphyrin IX monomethyl ester cyclase